MSTLVTTAKQAVRNIARFSHELDASPDLQSRLSYARAWYAHRENDVWHFGPSKFCGYQGMTAAEYVDDDPRDGRRTERQLSQWFTEISEDAPLYEELAIGLTAMLAKHGKVPSAKMRINVSTEFYEIYSATGEPDDRAITDLLIAVARRLPKIERERVRSAL
ncbi:hypothetical protein JQK15_22410 [Sphingobium sp. BHU LFT2]|uniref:hypothetical protein n=1 Tax=Sphingobium sp. BHU LFT2 TaxID=2807634 RepID=UPI001BEC7884|nr:hypothetical protein [Sphingobium sp. BHU LFT2]MBT2246262.1 hypothetical protein [Sphingobium sp. BHU LFT2]